LEEIESSARRDLVDAVSRLKTELSQSVVAMNDFSRQVRQAISETRDATTSDITEFAGTAVGGLREVVDTAKAAIQIEASELASRAKRHAAAFDRLVGSLEKHGDNLDRLSEAHERIVGTLDGINEASAAARVATSSFAADSDAIATGLHSIRESAEIVR